MKDNDTRRRNYNIAPCASYAQGMGLLSWIGWGYWLLMDLEGRTEDSLCKKGFIKATKYKNKTKKDGC